MHVAPTIKGRWRRRAKVGGAWPPTPTSHAWTRQGAMLRLVRAIFLPLATVYDTIPHGPRDPLGPYCVWKRDDIRNYWAAQQQQNNDL